MASPYFQPLRATQADFSGLQRGAEASARMMENQGKLIGGLIEKVGSAYFEKKRTERVADTFMQSEQFADIALRSGMTLEEVDAIQSDAEVRKKEGQQFIRDNGGMDAMVKNYREQIDLLQKEQKHNAYMDSIELQNAQSKLNIQQKQNELDREKYKSMYYQNKSKTDQLTDEELKKNFIDSGGSAQNAFLAQAELNKQLGLGIYNPRYLMELKNAFRKQERDGTQVEGLQFTSKSEADNYLNQIIQSPAGQQLRPEQITQLTKEFHSNVIPAGEVQKTADGIAKNLGGGAFAQVIGQEGALAQSRLLIQGALSEVNDFDEQGNPIKTFVVTNPTSANIALIKLARLAQGAGQLTDKDVDRIKGSQVLQHVFYRFAEKNFGQEITLTRELVEKGGAYHGAYNKEEEREYQVGDTVTVGGAEISADDLLFMRDITDRMKTHFASVINTYTPKLFEGLKESYGGLTLEEINSLIGSPADMMEGGIDALMPNKPFVQSYAKAFRRALDANPNLTAEVFADNSAQSPEERRKLFLTAKQVQAQMQGQVGNMQSPEDAGAGANGTDMQSIIDESTRRINLDLAQQANDQIGKSVLGGIATGAVASSIGEKAYNRTIGASKYIAENMPKEMFKEVESRVANSGGSMTRRQAMVEIIDEKLKDPKTLQLTAKKYGLDPKSDEWLPHKKGEAGLKKELKKRMDKAFQAGVKGNPFAGKSTESAEKTIKAKLKKAGSTLFSKKGIAYLAKKGLLHVGASLATGGLAGIISAASAISDIREMGENSLREKIADLENKKSTTTDEKELRIIDAMLSDYNRALQKYDNPLSWNHPYHFGK